MVDLPHRSPRPVGSLLLAPRAALVLAGVLLGLGGPPAALSQQSGYGQTMGSSPMEQQLYNNDPGSGSRPGGSSPGLNPANPLDLINRIRKGAAMDNATPPGDAVDQALKELEAQSAPPPTAPVGPVVTTPLPSGGATAATP